VGKPRAQDKTYDSSGEEDEEVGADDGEEEVRGYYGYETGSSFFLSLKNEITCTACAGG
jgi:hypothetical protein